MSEDLTMDTDVSRTLRDPRRKDTPFERARPSSEERPTKQRRTENTGGSQGARFRTLWSR